MAIIYMDKKLSLGTDSTHTASSWQIALDAEFTDIIDESLNDKVNLLKWTSPLKKPDGDYYSDLTELYARVKVHHGVDESPWFSIVENQNVQDYEITDVDGSVTNATSAELGID